MAGSDQEVLKSKDSFCGEHVHHKYHEILFIGPLIWYFGELLMRGNPTGDEQIGDRLNGITSDYTDQISKRMSNLQPRR